MISVSDKSHIVSFARSLSARGFEILSTGGTLKALLAENVPARSVEDYTGSPEVMGPAGTKIAGRWPKLSAAMTRPGTILSQTPR